MTIVTNTIAQSGGEYSSIQAWEDATNLNGGADIWKGVISDNNNYDEDVVQDQDGTSDSSYVWLDVDLANRHDGQPGTGHARMVLTSSTGHAFTTTGNRFRISGLEMKADTGTNSQECIRWTDVTLLLVEQCILWNDSDVADQEGAYNHQSAAQATFVNCLIYGQPRGGITSNHTDTSGDSQIEVIHCTIVKCGDTTVGNGHNGGGMHWRAHGTSTGIGGIVYNSILGSQDPTSSTVTSFSRSNSADFDIGLSGSNNALLDDRFDDVDDYDGCSANAIQNLNPATNFTSYGSHTSPLSTDDFSVQDSAADIYEAGLAPGSFSGLADSRPDFTVDIVGTTRKSTPDIGCFELGPQNPIYFQDSFRVYNDDGTGLGEAP